MDDNNPYLPPRTILPPTAPRPPRTIRGEFLVLAMIFGPLVLVAVALFIVLN
jgi:hypothetical protein